MNAYVATASCQLMANGLAVNEQSASGMGTSFAGRSSSAQDASTVFGNPAGMSRLKRAEISGGIAAVWPETDIDAADSNMATGTNKGDIAPDAQVPFAYYVRPLNDKWHFGLGLYVPFGVISDYEKSFQGRDHGLYSKVQVTTLQPTFSYRINDRVAVGFGPTINKIDGKLTSNPTANLGLPDSYVRIKGDDIGYGYNLGVLVDVTERLSWGLSYRSKVDYELEGSISFAGFPDGFGYPDSRHSGTVDITMPESVDTSITYQANDKWTIYAGSTWTRWSRLKELEVVHKGPKPDPLEPLNWENSWSHAIGVAYQITPSVVLRSGFSLDASPTSNEHRTVRIPVSNRKIYSLGLGWNIDQDWTVDVAYAYVDESKGQVNQAASFHTAEYTAEYDNSAHGLGIQLTHRF
ncbi:MAG: outer membrane protein transport protein [Pseudomonas sp.]